MLNFYKTKLSQSFHIMKHIFFTNLKNSLNLTSWKDSHDLSVDLSVDCFSL